MAKGSGSTRASSWRDKGKLSPEQAYYEYTHGGGIHNESKLTAMDKLFKPATEDIDLHRGTSVNELLAIMQENGFKGDIEDIEGMTFNMKHYESTTGVDTYAEDYATDAFGLLGTSAFNTPVVLHLNVKKGTPVVKRSEHTDTVGRGASQEYTIGRNVEWTVDYVANSINDSYGEDYYEIGVTVRPRK